MVTTMESPLLMFFTPIDDYDLPSIAADIAEDVSLGLWLRGKKPTRTECSQGVVTRIIQCPLCHYPIEDEFYPTHLTLYHRQGY